MRDLTCTLSGSMRRYLPEMETEAAALKRAGTTILSPRSFAARSADNGFVFVEGDDEDSPAQIQARHLALIAGSDFVRLVCPEGYVGASAAEEIGYALALGVPVYATETLLEQVFADQVEVVAVMDADWHERMRSQIGLQPSRTLALLRLQLWATDMTVRKGFDDETLDELLLLLVEEIAELVAATRPSESRFDGIFDELATIRQRARQARSQADIAISAQTSSASIPSELADVQIYLALIAERTGHDLNAAVIEKTEADVRRHWQRQNR